MKPLDKALMAAAGNVTAAGPSNAWDLDYAEIDLDSSGFWDISTAGAGAQPSTVSVGGNPQAIVFKPDGTRMYVTGSGSDTVKEYSFDSPWDIHSATQLYAFGVGTQAAQSSGLFFKPDGLKFYVADYFSGTIFEYACTTAWTMSTASYNNVSLDISSYETQLHAVFFKSDGKKMYTCGSAGDDINEWNLDTAWDLANAEYLRAFSVSAQDTYPSDVFFKPDGTRMYVVGDTGNDINEYKMESPAGTPWDISTASYVQNFNIGSQETNPRGIYFRPDGSRFYVIGLNGDAVDEYFCGDKRLTDVNSQEANPTGLFFKSDGSKMFIIGSTGDDVNEYTLGTDWDPSTATWVRSASVSSQDTTPSGIFFKSDGLTFYVVGLTNDTVYQYTCDDPWDLTTVTYTNKSFYVGSEEAGPQAVFFSSDGLKMYITGNTGDDVNEFDLGTAWDVSTADFLRKKSVNSEATYPTGLSFSADGDKMYVIGLDNDEIHQYDLTTDWDVSTAGYSKSLSVASVHTLPRGIYFKPDGTGFFTIGNSVDDVVPWKIT